MSFVLRIAYRKCFVYSIVNPVYSILLQKNLKTVAKVNPGNYLVNSSYSTDSLCSLKQPTAKSSNLTGQIAATDFDLIQKLLNCSYISLASSANLKKQKLEDVMEKVNKLKASGMDEEIILKNPYIICNTLNKLTENIATLRANAIPFNERTVLLLACSSATYLLRLYENEYHKKLDYLVNQLEVSHSRLFNTIPKCLIVLATPLERVQAMVTLLKDAGVTNEAIIKDLRVLQLNTATAELRLQEAKAAKAPIKTWMVSCGQISFDRSLEHWKNTNSVLGEEDVVSYLEKRLQRDRDIIQHMMKTYRIKGRFPYRLKKVIDFLFEEGYSREDILQCPRILAQDLLKIQQRHSQVLSLGYRPKGLVMYTYSNKRYAAFLEKIEYPYNRFS